MELIDKAEVVAEIEELDEFWHLSKSPDGQAFIESLLSFLDDIEVKEVDLEKEIDILWCSLFTNNTMKRDPTNPHTFIPDPAYTKDGAKIAYTLEIDWKIGKIDTDADFLMKIARHFFELELKAKIGGRE